MISTAGTEDGPPSLERLGVDLGASLGIVARKASFDDIPISLLYKTTL